MMADANKPSLLDRVKDMAKELGLEGEDLEKYVDQHMQKAGWKRKMDYEPPDGSNDSGKKSDGWF
jgi:hypothetical protein